MPPNTVRVAVTQAEPEWIDLAAGNAGFWDALVGYGLAYWMYHGTYHTSRILLRLDSPEMEQIKACAKSNSIAVALGFSENDQNSLYIAQVLIGQDGGIKMHRRKMKPTHIERTIFGDASGQCLSSVAELPFARVGALSCWEHIQPLLKFNTFAQGEDIHVAAWPSLTPHSGREGNDLWSMSAEGCQNLSRTYAIESQSFVLHCTALITDNGVEMMNTTGGAAMSSPGGGSSAIFGPDGRCLTEPVHSTTEGIIYADLDMDLTLQAKMFSDGMGHYSRPDLMWLGVCKKVRKMVVEESDAEQNEAEDNLKP